MSTPRFILAKYVPDLQRMEPRNIGILLWHKGRVQWKFLPDEKAASFVNEMSVYREWVDFWEALVSADEIDAPGMAVVPKTNEECIDAIISTQAGNYLLVDAGFVPAKLAIRDIPKAVEYLYGELIDTEITTEISVERRATFQSRCDSIFETVGVEVKRNEPIVCHLFGGHRRFHCDYYVGNGQPDAVFQRAHLSSEQSVNNAALLLHELIERDLVERNSCGALIEGHAAQSAAGKEGYDWLSRICPVIDVESEEAADKIAHIASNGQH